MKKTSKAIALAILLAAFSNHSFAQASASATATASATIVTPISIAKATNGDMSFGNIAVGASGGTVVLSPAGSRTETGGVTLPTTVTGTVAAASFDVTGQGNYTYAITLPSSAVTLTRSGGSETMTIDNFTSTPDGTGTLSSGSDNIKVGATLNVGASQVAGTYTSDTFTVSVVYN
jgi:hypothetical protein